MADIQCNLIYEQCCLWTEDIVCTWAAYLLTMPIKIYFYPSQKGARNETQMAHVCNGGLNLTHWLNLVCGLELEPNVHDWLCAHEVKQWMLTRARFVHSVFILVHRLDYLNNFAATGPFRAKLGW